MTPCQGPSGRPLPDSVVDVSRMAAMRNPHPSQGPYRIWPRMGVPSRVRIHQTHNVLTNIGQGFGFQPGLYKSSARKWTICQNVFTFRVYLISSEIGKKTTYCHTY